MGLFTDTPREKGGTGQSNNDDDDDNNNKDIYKRP
jgi:hypothetical protein